MSIWYWRGARVHQRNLILRTPALRSLKSEMRASGAGSGKVPGALRTASTMRDFISAMSFTPVKVRSYSHRRISLAVLTMTGVSEQIRVGDNYTSFIIGFYDCRSGLNLLYRAFKSIDLYFISNSKWLRPQ